MFPKGTIYQSGKKRLEDEVVFSLTKTERFAYHLLRVIGAGLVAFVIVGAIFTYAPAVKEEIYYRLHGQELSPVRSKFGDLINFAEAERSARIQKEAGSFGVNSHFAVVVPKINASSNVIANVDTANESEYLDALMHGVAHAKGTYFPGQGRNIYLFSHSTDSPVNVSRYNAVFYLLRKLERDDKIIVYFADKRYEYEVKKKIVTSAKDTSWLTQRKDHEALILQTCDPPGTTWRRLIIIAEPIGEGI